MDKLLTMSKKELNRWAISTSRVHCHMPSDSLYYKRHVAIPFMAQAGWDASR
jgi:hypothetical protein